MKQFPTLYKLASTGTIQQWTIFVDNDSYWTESGQVDGAITKTDPTKCIGKNIGKANQTTDHEQALAEAQSKWDKKLRLDYSEDINTVQAAKVRNFEPMLANKFLDREKKGKITYPLMINPKLDGHRMILKADGAFTRKGGLQCTVVHIQDLFKRVFDKYPDLVLDGEIYNHDLCEEFQEISSLARRTKPTIGDLFEAEEKLQYHIYDCPCTGDKLEEDPYIDRMNDLKRILKEFGIENHRYIRLVDYYIAQTREEVDTYHLKFIEEGYEGVIIRFNKPYERKRSNNLLKLKLFEDAEFKLLDVLPGKGNRATWAAKVVCEIPNNTFSAGVIGNKDYCQNLLQNKSKFIGVMATIKFFGYTDADKPRHGKLKDLGRTDI